MKNKLFIKCDRQSGVHLLRVPKPRYSQGSPQLFQGYPRLTVIFAVVNPGCTKVENSKEVDSLGTRLSPAWGAKFRTKDACPALVLIKYLGHCLPRWAVSSPPQPQSSDQSPSCSHCTDKAVLLIKTLNFIPDPEFLHNWDPDPGLCGCGSTKLLTTDPIRIRIHNTR